MLTLFKYKRINEIERLFSYKNSCMASSIWSNSSEKLGLISLRFDARCSYWGCEIYSIKEEFMNVFSDILYKSIALVAISWILGDLTYRLVLSHIVSGLVSYTLWVCSA